MFKYYYEEEQIARKQVMFAASRRLLPLPLANSGGPVKTAEAHVDLVSMIWSYNVDILS